MNPTAIRFILIDDDLTQHYLFKYLADNNPDLDLVAAGKDGRDLLPLYQQHPTRRCDSRPTHEPTRWTRRNEDVDCATPQCKSYYIIQQALLNFM